MCVSEEREKENEDNGWITEEESIYYQRLHLYLHSSQVMAYYLSYHH